MCRRPTEKTVTIDPATALCGVAIPTPSSGEQRDPARPPSSVRRRTRCGFRVSYGLSLDVPGPGRRGPQPADGRGAGARLAAAVRRQIDGGVAGVPRGLDAVGVAG